MSLSKLHMWRRKRDFPYFVSMGLVLGLCQERKLWSRHRSQHWWNHIVKETFDDKCWIENFRMTRATFNFLCEELKPSFPVMDVYVRDPLKLDHKVGIAIYWLASDAEYRTIASLFGVGVSTVHKCVHDVCNAIADRLLAKYVKFPENDELRHVINWFQETWGFPNCAGAIDGTHVPIIAPSLAHGDYLNRKGWYSVLLQAVCDHRYIITDINVGWPGKVHDARVFGNSELYLKGETNDLFPNWTKQLNLPDKQVSMPIVIVGDAAYPLKPWLLKPYTHIARLSEEQKAFNYRLSQARMTIENTFGRLKGRWRCLMKRLDVDVEFVSVIITTCVILHNICEMRHENFMADEAIEDEDDEDVNDDDGGGGEGVLCAKRLRDDVARYFSTD